MKSVFLYRGILFVVALSLFSSCQKEIDSSGAGGVVPIIPVDQKPKLGTTWTYSYATFYATGGLENTRQLVLKAKTEDSIAGEKWLNIVDVAADTTVWLLNTKTSGLYQYANNSSNLFCKDPASVNDTYSTFNSGAPGDFTVKAVNDTLPTGIGNIPANYYEGVKNGLIIDYIWYNKNAWIVRKILWRKLAPPSTAFYRYSTMYLGNIAY